MQAKWKIQKLPFLLISVVCLGPGFFSLSRAQVLFSPDIPAQIGGQLFREYEIVVYDPGSEISPLYSAAREGGNIDACGLFEGYIVYSMDVSAEWDFGEVREYDLAGYRSNNGDVTTMLFLNGQTVGIPEGADVDAAMVLPDGRVVFSLDIPAVVNGIPFSHNDLILCNGVSVDEFFRGAAAGIPDEANIDGVYLIEDTDDDGIPSPGSGHGSEVLFSLDIPTEMNGVAFTDKDIIRCGEPPCSKYSDVLSSALSMSVDVDAFALIIDNCPEHHNPSQEDMDADGRGDPCDECTDTDEDGYGNPGFPNLCEEDNCPSHFNPDQLDSYPPWGNGCGDDCECHADCNGDQTVNLTDLVMMRQEYFRTDCATNPCSADCNWDNQVNLTDLVMMRQEYFRTDCPACP